MGTAFKLFTAILIFMDSAQDGNDFFFSRQRDGTGNFCAGALCGFNDFFCGLVNQLMVVCL